MGDNLIAESTEFLIRQENPECEVYHKELFLRWKYQRGLSKYLALLLTILRVVTERYKMYAAAEWLFSLQHTGYYKKAMREADCVIVTSGMLKYNSQAHAYMYAAVCRVAEQMAKPLLLNAKSVQVGNSMDLRYEMVCRALHRKGVFINTRDGEDAVKILKKDYGVERLAYVGDPALWAKEMSGAAKMTQGERVIGINLIRPSIYQDYGQGIPSERIVQLYKDLLRLLNEKGYKWKLFCNGMRDDYALITEICPGGCTENLKITPPIRYRSLYRPLLRLM